MRVRQSLSRDKPLKLRYPHAMRFPSLAFVALVWSMLNVHGAESQSNRYNVLFVAIDDLRPELGCYGVADAQSPHLDAFAESATLFDRHYVQSATCGASRYALLTGRSPANSGVTSKNNGLYGGPSALSHEPQPGAQSMPELFRRSGYHTVCLGKISHTADGRVYSYDGKGDGRDEVPHAWDALPTPFGDWKRGWGVFFAYPDGKHREDGEGHRDLMDFKATEDNDLPDGLLAQEAITQLKALSETDKPFFLGLGFFKPHLPFVAPKQDWDAFDDADIVPPSFPERVDSPHWHQSGEFYKYDSGMEKTRPLSLEDRIAARRAYLASVRYTDRQVGKVLDALDQLGLSKNTVVVVWGDHGWHLGEQALWGKHTPFELAMRSALLIRAPGFADQPSRSEALVETIDLYPTLVSLCQPRFTATHHQLDGLDLSPILRNEREGVREVSTSYWNQTVSLRSATHRLLIHPKHEELHDLRQNLANTKNVLQSQPEAASKLRAWAP